MFKSKWDEWYDKQPAATKAWIDRETAKNNELIRSIAFPSILLGLLIGFILGLGV